MGSLPFYHEKPGLIITGANSKYQPELAAFLEKAGDRSPQAPREGPVSRSETSAAAAQRVKTIPLSSRLRMNDDRDRLGLGYSTFFAEVEVPTPREDRVRVRIAITETGRGRLQDVQLNLQLRLQPGETLETAKTKIVLDAGRVELLPEQIAVLSAACIRRRIFDHSTPRQPRH